MIFSAGRVVNKSDRKENHALKIAVAKMLESSQENSLDSVCVTNVAGPK